MLSSCYGSWALLPSEMTVETDCQWHCCRQCSLLTQEICAFTCSVGIGCCGVQGRGRLICSSLESSCTICGSKVLNHDLLTLFSFPMRISPCFFCADLACFIIPEELHCVCINPVYRIKHWYSSRQHNSKCFLRCSKSSHLTKVLGYH